MNNKYNFNSVMAGRITGFALNIWSEAVGDRLIAVRVIGEQVGYICYLSLSVCEGAADTGRVGHIKIVHYLSPGDYQ